LRSYKYEERRSLAVAQSFASPCVSDSECTNNCCKNVNINQKYSYYNSAAIYAGYYATSYGVYTYRYSSYYPYYKVTEGIFLKSAKVCMSATDAKNYNICPLKVTATPVTISYKSTGGSGDAVGGIIGLCCCCGIGIGIWFMCCRAKPQPQQTVVVVKGNDSSDDKPDVVHNTTVINNTTSNTVMQPGMMGGMPMGGMPMGGAPMGGMPMGQPMMQQPGMMPQPGYGQPAYGAPGYPPQGYP
jgi:hypothetical protein